MTRLLASIPDTSTSRDRRSWVNDSFRPTAFSDTFSLAPSRLATTTKTMRAGLRNYH